MQKLKRVRLPDHSFPGAEHTFNGAAAALKAVQQTVKNHDLLKNTERRNRNVSVLLQDPDLFFRIDRRRKAAAAARIESKLGKKP